MTGSANHSAPKIEEERRHTLIAKQDIRLPSHNPDGSKPDHDHDHAESDA